MQHNILFINKMIDAIFEDQYKPILNDHLTKFRIVRRADLLLKLLKSGD